MALCTLQDKLFVCFLPINRAYLYCKQMWANGVTVCKWAWTLMKPSKVKLSASFIMWIVGCIWELKWGISPSLFQMCFLQVPQFHWNAIYSAVAVTKYSDSSTVLEYSLEGLELYSFGSLSRRMTESFSAAAVRQVSKGCTDLSSWLFTSPLWVLSLSD